MSATLSVGLSRQIRIVSALTIREVRLRNSKHAFQQLFDILETVVFILVHWIIFKVLQRHLLIGDSLLMFIATGILPILFFRTISMKTAGAIEASKAVTNIPFIEPIDYSVAKSFVEVIVFVLTFSFFFAMISAFELSRFAIPYDFSMIALTLALLTLFSFGIGLINSFLIYLFPIWKFLWSFFARVQIFFSAVFFIPEYMPPKIKEILAYNPLMHFVALFRSAFYPTYPTHMISIPYVLGWTAAVMMLGLASERAVRNRRSTH